MPTISLVAEDVLHIGSIAITNSLLTTWVGILCVTFFLILLQWKKFHLVPRGIQLILEEVYAFFLSLCENVLGEKRMAEKATPFITTIFFFVLVANIPEILPGVGSIGFFKGEEGFIPLFRPGTADLNTTLALALISVGVTQVVGFRALKFGYIKKFFNFSSPLRFFVGILELISEFTKIISFSFRLFGNIFAGEVLLAVLFFILPYFVPIPFYGLELFVALIQSFVFAMLTLVFLKIAMTGHDGEEHV